MDIRALATELATDPLRIGYAGKDTKQACALLNAPRDRARTSITGVELWENTVLAEYAALTQPGRDAYQVLVSLSTIGVSAGSNSRAVLLALFGAATATRANLIAFVGKALKESRAEALGLGIVAEGNVIDALALEAMHG